MSFTASLDEIVAENFNGLLAKPPHWPRARLGDLAVIRNGIPLPSSGFNGSHGVPVVRIRNVLAGTTATLFDGPVEEDWYIDHGDLLIGMDGDFNCARWRGPRALLNQRVCMLRPADDRVTARYLELVLPGYLAAVNKHTPSITVKHLSSRTIAELPIPVPPRDDQEALVASIDTHFSRLDAAVASLKRAKANVKRARASVLQAAVEGRLVPTEAELARAEGRDYESASALLARILAERKAVWEASGARGKYKEPGAPFTAGLPLLPDGWAWATPGQLASGERYDIGIGPFGSNLRVPDYRENGVPLVFVRHVRAEAFTGLDDKYVTQEKARELRAHRVRSGDVVITKMGEPPGDSALYPVGAPDGVVTADVIKWTPSQHLVARYLVYATKTAALRKQILSQTQGVAQKKVSLQRFLRIAYPVPPLPEQHRIVAEVDRRFSVLDAVDAPIDANLARCARLRQSILQRAFSGRLVPGDVANPERLVTASQ